MLVRVLHLRRLCLPVSVTALTLALAITSLHAQQTPTPANPRPATQPANLPASDQEDTEVAALDKELSAAAEEPLTLTGLASANDAGPAGIIPFARGFNFSLGSTSQHDSADGWSSILNPDLAYRFSSHWSLNAGIPVYSHILIGTQEQPPPPKPGAALPPPIQVLKARSFLLGDAFVALDFAIERHVLNYNITGTIGTPTGDYIDGLGSGQYTYNINNHFERTFFDWFTPELELGIGDSSELLDSRVRNAYIVVGENAHFQFGFDFSLPFNTTFSTVAYEDLPLSTQTVTSTTTNGKKGKQQKIITTYSQESIGEDNGFLNTLDIPINGHVTLSGFYDRSLRNKTDTAGFSLTFLLRSAPHGRSEVH